VTVTVCQFHDPGARLERDWLMPRSTPANEFDRWLAGAREVALTQQAQPFVTVDLECAAIQPSAG
jgi:hypothetical protein